MNYVRSGLYPSIVVFVERSVVQICCQNQLYPWAPKTLRSRATAQFCSRASPRVALIISNVLCTCELWGHPCTALSMLISPSGGWSFFEIVSIPFSTTNISRVFISIWKIDNNPLFPRHTAHGTMRRWKMEHPRRYLSFLVNTQQETCIPSNTRTQKRDRLGEKWTVYTNV